MRIDEIIKTYFLTKTDSFTKIESQRINRRFFEIRSIEYLWDENKHIFENKIELTKYIGTMNLVSFTGSYNLTGICEYCGANTDFVSIGRGFKKHCSKICEINARKETCMERYGGNSPASNNIIKDKMQKTCMERYGGNSPASNNIIKDKMQKTCMERYGFANPFQVEEFKKKGAETRLNKFGYEYTLQNPKNLQKIKDYFKSNGKWYNYDNLLDKEYYYAMVGLIERKFSDDILKLENYDKRGRLDLDQEAYHLDHKFSKIEGFEKCILPYYIGNINNLEMIQGSINLSKNRKCSISLEELIELIEKNIDL